MAAHITSLRTMQDYINYYGKEQGVLKFSRLARKPIASARYPDDKTMKESPAEFAARLTEGERNYLNQCGDLEAAERAAHPMYVLTPGRLSPGEVQKKFFEGPGSNWGQPKAQSKLESALEAVVNVGSGFIIANCTYLFIVGPLFDLPLDVVMSMQINAIFLTVSIARSYVWRRFFNASIHKRIHQWATS